MIIFTQQYLELWHQIIERHYIKGVVGVRETRKTRNQRRQERMENLFTALIVLTFACCLCLLLCVMACRAMVVECPIDGREYITMVQSWGQDK